MQCSAMTAVPRAVPSRHSKLRTMRLFIAWSISPAAAREIARVVLPLKERLPSASWVRPEAYHLTFAFLGEQSEDLVAALEKSLAPRLLRHLAFDVRLSFPGFFPSPRRPRVGWLAADPAEPLVAIAKDVGARLKDAGVELDEKPFHPHLTLVRTRDRWTARHTEIFLRALDGFRVDAGRVDHVSLFSSRLEPSGAVHSEVGRIPLGE